MTTCPNQQKNLKDCTCTFDCPRKGMCCECITYHRAQNQLPGCYFSKEAERTGDRSVAHFVRENA
ncbi:TPA: hypothetical protein DDW35_09790 [Candidatus Sumerlaeota bacterium]|nr:hypothetical protein [Candidatus Sumerlaeota bacterium]